MIFASRTDKGLVRASNQDSVLVCPPLFGVADGMGGHKAGDVASRLTVEKLKGVLTDAAPSESLLVGAIEEINAFLYEMQLKNIDLQGMGTTLSVAWEADRYILLGHVGDSRAYLRRKGVLTQVTTDHSLVNEMVMKGLITKEAARTNPYRNVITRAIGTDPEVKPDIIRVNKKKGDKWLICSDGLSGLVTDDEMNEMLGSMTLEKTADALLQKAMERGAYDNISLVLAEVDK